MTFIVISLIFLIPSFLPALSIEEGITDPGLKKVWELIRANRSDEALQQLSLIRPGGENRVYYHFCYGRALETLKKPLDAMDHYRLAYLNAPPGELKEAALLERAEGYLRIRNYYEAKIAFHLFLIDFKKSKYLEKATLGMAQSLLAIERLPEALTYYEKAGAEPPALFGRATVLHRLGRIKEADEFFAKAIAKDKITFLNSEELLFFYGENLQQMGKDQEAIPYLSSTIRDPALKKKAEIVLGLIALKARRVEEALKYFNSALSSSDRQVRAEALFHLAETQLEAGKTNEARQALQEYRLRYPLGKNFEAVLLKLAKLEMDGERFEPAGGLIRELVLRSSPKKETLQELEEFFIKMKEKDPRQIASLWSSMGAKYMGAFREPFLLQMSEALKGSGKPYFDLHQWLVKNGSLKVKIQSLIVLAGYQAEASDLEGAMAALNALKKNKISGDQILRLEARILHARMDYGGAVEKLLALKNMETQDLPLLEDTLASAKDVNKALAVFEKNVLRSGGNSRSYNRIADLFYEKGKKKEALHYYQKALEKDPLNEWALFRTGSLMEGVEGQKVLGRIKDANSILGKLARVNLKEKEIERKIGEIF